MDNRRGGKIYYLIREHGKVACRGRIQTDGYHRTLFKNLTGRGRIGNLGDRGLVTNRSWGPYGPCQKIPKSLSEQQTCVQKGSQVSQVWDMADPPENSYCPFLLTHLKWTLEP